MKIYCSLDPLHPMKSKIHPNLDLHNCTVYGEAKCFTCPRRYDGARIEKYMAENPRKEC